MKKGCLILIALFMVFINLSAEKLDWGIFAGPNVSNLYGNDTSYELMYQIYAKDLVLNAPATEIGTYYVKSGDSKANLGVSVGAYANFLLKDYLNKTNQLYFRPEIEWKLAKIKYSFGNEVINTGIFDPSYYEESDFPNPSTFKNTTTFNYIEIPLLLKYTTSGTLQDPLPTSMNKAFIEFGPSVAIAISQSDSYSTGMKKIEDFAKLLVSQSDSEIKYSYTKENTTDNFTSFSIGVTGGFGWEFNNVFGPNENPLSVEFRGDFGLTSFSGNDNLDTKLYSVKFLLGYPF
ncbi:MAG TPA: outer membrane beta-barrel protein [Candidatus Cloacimonadota bacterium]|nr:outer membrane beta-barrel protein [Candidatus Cloacimonadota bacterium]HPT71293.1 outer membrane beta-barrel protein [Candidatus Cloacimonadota bacterium]